MKSEKPDTIQFQKRVDDMRQQFSNQSKEAVKVARAHYANDLHEHKQKAERATAELEKLSGPNSRLKKLEDEKTELNRQLSELEGRNRNLASKESAATAELSTLRSQTEGLQNEAQEANEKAVATEKSRQETQSELDKTKEALREASSSAQRVEELGEQVRTLAEKEKALRKDLDEADENAANRHARDEVELEDDWAAEVFQVEEELEKSKDKCHEAEAEALKASNECRQLREENKKLRQQLESAQVNGATSSRPQSSAMTQNSTPAMLPPPKETTRRRARKVADRSAQSVANTEHSSSLPQSGQATSQETSGSSKGFFDSEEQVMIPRTSNESPDDYEAFNEFIEENGTQVVPPTFPSWTANESEETTGMFSQTLDGPSQLPERASSSHSEFQDLYQQPVEEVSLVDQARPALPATPRQGRSVMFRDERPRSRANTGRRLSQIGSSDSQGTPLAGKSQSDYQRSPSISLNNLSNEGDDSPDFVKTPSQHILKTYGKHNMTERGGNSRSRPGSQSSTTSTKRRASESARETESQKRMREVEVIDLDSQTTDTQGSRPARTLSQSTHVSETQFPSQLRPQSQSQSYSQSRSQASSPAHTRMRSSQGRSASMTGPSQSVKNRRRTSGCKFTENRKANLCWGGMCTNHSSRSSDERAFLPRDKEIIQLLNRTRRKSA